ncbi:Aste57867_7030 [Aphanomyces stellatus]|nr:hypothetical protein As57867_007007 [Aphanomyces stellatus]VFT83978.1 Aste57867_7030 [Aphanomyces stellatus]
MKRLERRNRVLKQREYDRHMKRLYRQKEKTERVDLIYEIDELSRVVESMLERRRVWEATKGTRVAWKDICMGLREESGLSSAQHAALKEQVHQYKALAQRMKIWVLLNAMPRVALDGRVSTWRDVSLMAHPTSRQLGKEWIAKQLIHQTKAVFHTYGFPTKTENVFFFDLVVENESVEYIWGHQYDLRDGWEAFMTSLCPNLCALLMLDLTHSVPLNDGSLYLHQMTTVAGEFINLIATSFQKHDGGSILVAQSVADDETIQLTNGSVVRHVSFWYDEALKSTINAIRGDIYAQSHPHGQWKRRTLLRQRRLRPLGWVSLQEEGRYWGCDLTQVPPDLRESVFRRHVFQTYYMLDRTSFSRFQRIEQNAKTTQA